MLTTTTRTTKAAVITRDLDLTRCEGFAVAVVTELTKLRTVEHTKTDVYELRRIPTEIGGVAVEVKKLTEDKEVYHVHLDGTSSSCTCPGGTYRNACRHMDMCREAFREGLLNG
jgi:hypothetical protein